MTDFYQQCEDGLIAKLQTLTTYFPNSWQVTDDDTKIGKGGDHFAIVRPGSFPYTRQNGKLAEFEWHSTLVLHMRFTEYDTAWSLFKAFRSAVINLLINDPTLGSTPRVFGVIPSSSEEPGYMTDSEGNSANIIIQALDVAIRQRVPVATAL